MGQAKDDKILCVAEVAEGHTDVVLDPHAGPCDSWSDDKDSHPYVSLFAGSVRFKSIQWSGFIGWFAALCAVIMYIVSVGLANVARDHHCHQVLVYGQVSNAGGGANATTPIMAPQTYQPAYGSAPANANYNDTM